MYSRIYRYVYCNMVTTDFSYWLSKYKFNSYLLPLFKFNKDTTHEISKLNEIELVLSTLKNLIQPLTYKWSRQIEWLVYKQKHSDFLSVYITWCWWLLKNWWKTKIKNKQFTIWVKYLDKVKWSDKIDKHWN